MEIKVLGKGCKNCLLLEKHVKLALEMMDAKANIEHVTDIDRIVEYGVMSTPALVVNGEVLSTGKILSPKKLVSLLSAYQ